jgi:hypothetical protein
MRAQEDALQTELLHDLRTGGQFLKFVYGGLRGNASEENCAALVREVMRSLDEGDANLALWEQLSVQSPLYNCALRLPRFALRDHSR